MYIDVKSLVKINGTSSEYFNCNVGVRQGENLSPFLFSLYIDDLENFLVEKDIAGLQNIENAIEDELMVYVKMLILLYADDTVLLAESSEGLQNALNAFHTYCKQWKLNVNVEKTKILIFSKGPLIKKEFHYNNNGIENVKEFKYLGIILTRGGTFCKAKKHLSEQAQKAMYGVIRKIRQFDLSVECQLDLFDKIVVPVLLYGCEIWGYENLDIIERVHLKFLKTIFNLKSSTPSYMIYGESGRFPLYIKVYSRMITYWRKLLYSENKIANIVYRYFCTEYCKNVYKNPWIECIERILNMCGLPNVWKDQGYCVNIKWLSIKVNQVLKDQFIQKWSSDIDGSSKGQSYKLFKHTFGVEKYVFTLPVKLRKILMKFRTSNHRLPVETGRWYGIPLNERMCTYCNKGEIGDEFHFILQCPNFSQSRKKFIDKCYYERPNVLKFSNLMSTQNIKMLKKLCIFISHIFDTICCSS